VNPSIPAKLSRLPEIPGLFKPDLETSKSYAKDHLFYKRLFLKGIKVEANLLPLKKRKQFSLFC
jgi:hypothetical protein